MKKLLLFCALSLGSTTCVYSQTWFPTGAKASIGASYLVTACQLGSNIMVIGNQQQFGRSTDAGSTWTMPAITPPNGTFIALFNAGDRIYANMKINTYNFELHYSLDNGTTWTRDTVGIPQNYVNTGKLSMNVVNMGNNYLMAYDGTHTCYKQNGAASWTEVSVSVSIADITSLNDVWYVLGNTNIMKSTDHGVSWAPAPLNGLPSGAGWYKITTNGINRMFILEGPGSGGDEIYFSDDSGANWSLTNSAGHYTYQYPYIGYMHAVGDYLFAAVNPEQFAFNDAPPFLVSSSTVPNFQVGDTSGLYNGPTVAVLPFFFHIGAKLFTLNSDLMSSTPGFSATASTPETKLSGVKVYPNPASEILNIDAPIASEWELYNISGQHLNFGKTTNTNTKIDVSGLQPGVYLLKIQLEGNSQIVKFTK